MKTPPNTSLLSLSHAIAKARRGAGIKQEAAAKALGIARSSLSKYENGNMEGLTIATLLSMSHLFKVSIQDLFHPSADSSKKDLLPPHLLE